MHSNIDIRDLDCELDENAVCITCGKSARNQSVRRNCKGKRGKSRKEIQRREEEKYEKLIENIFPLGTYTATFLTSIGITKEFVGKLKGEIGCRSCDSKEEWLNRLGALIGKKVQEFLKKV